jgi:hypothetical protein
VLAVVALEAEQQELEDSVKMAVEMVEMLQTIAPLVLLTQVVVVAVVTAPKHSPDEQVVQA